MTYLLAKISWFVAMITFKVASAADMDFLVANITFVVAETIIMYGGCNHFFGS